MTKSTIVALIALTVVFTPGISSGQKSKTGSDSTVSIDKHPQDSPESKGFFIESPSKQSNLRILGSIRLFGSEDFKGLSGGTGFSLGKIPVNSPTSDETTFYMSANITRLGIEANQATGFGDLFMRIETDFNGDGKNFRIRHAYAQSDFLIAGQTWTGFSDIETLPITVDLDGPPTAISLRTVQVKYFNNFGDKWRFRASLELPSIAISIPDTVSVEPVTQSFPALAANLKKDWSAVSIKVAGILNPISVRDLDGNKNTLLGWGGLLSGRVDITGSTTFLTQALYGFGIASFLNLSGGNSYDVILNLQTSSYELAQTSGGFVSIAQKLFNRTIDLNVAFGIVNFRMEDYFDGSTFKFGYYAACNSFFNFNGNKVGLEYTYGFKGLKNDQNGNASRLAFTFYYDF